MHAGVDASRKGNKNFKDEEASSFSLTTAKPNQAQTDTQGKGRLIDLDVDDSGRILSSGVFALRDLRSRLEVVLAWERDSGSKVPSLNALLKAPEPQRKVDFGYPHLAPPTLNLSLTCQSLMLAQSTRHKYQSGEVSSTTGSVRGHQRGQRPGGEFEPGGRGRS